MRNFSPRPTLAVKATKYLADKTGRISAARQPEIEAELLYKNARQTKLFDDHIVKALSTLAGVGERCMFCGGSEASQIEHFWPKGPFPSRAMDWLNFVWACSVCNQNKGIKFPLLPGNIPMLINPLDEDVWDFFIIDDFGILTPKWDLIAGDINARAKITDVTIKLNRQAVQEARQVRLTHLKEEVQDSLLLHRHGYLSVADLRIRIERWLAFPLHPEVPQYFLLRDGRIDPPFLDLLALV